MKSIMFIKPTNKSRRKILKYTVCGFFLGAFVLPTGRPSKESTLLAKNPDLGTLLPGTMREIGKEYLNNYPDERSRSVLLNSIQSRFDVINGRPHSPSWAELKKLIMDDFQTDEVVYLKGWALSRTEARLAALSVV